MKKTLAFFIPVILLASVTSFSVHADNSGGAGGFGQTVCELPSGKLIFVPWQYCKIQGGKGEKTDF
ncbi:hypothetical protein L4D08_07125 [Photobacterium chitinilyticum]|uniref:hypothetical protein n=1 Tax=Photobacterium chitinilyticum TaxID=2485123 RepID=UPI003D0989EF